jgi:hypothetical protein
LRGILDKEENTSRQELLKAEGKAAVVLEDRIEMLEAILGEIEFVNIKSSLLEAPLPDLVEIQHDIKQRRQEYEEMGKLVFKASLPAVSAIGWIK